MTNKQTEVFNKFLEIKPLIKHAYTTGKSIVLTDVQSFIKLNVADLLAIEELGYVNVWMGYTGGKSIVFRPTLKGYKEVA